MNTLYYTTANSPRGDVIIMAAEEGIVWTSTPRTPIQNAQIWAKKHLKAEIKENNELPILKKTKQQLEDYFDGKKVEFTVPFIMTGTDFQKAVWTAMLNIPYGKTKSYGEVARLIGRPAAVRALGAACGSNPIAILIPCHRIVGSNGKLTGYGGGLPTKEWLLKLEQA